MMSGVVLALACVAAAAACLGVAAWKLWRELALRRGMKVQSIESQTEFIPREANTNLHQLHHEYPIVPPPRANPATEMLLREELLMATRQWAAPAQGTEIVPREVLLSLHRSFAPRSPEPAASEPKLHEFDPQLVAAERAFSRWAKARDSTTLERLADTFEPPLREALGVLADIGGDFCGELLDSPDSRGAAGAHRCQVAALVLLLRNEIQALRSIDRCIGSGWFVPELREVLSSWRGRETDARLRDLAQRAEARGFWLDQLDERRIDPGPVLLRELLASDDPDMVARGLRLAKYHGDAQLRMEAAQPYLANTSDPALRMASVELGVFDRQPAAWMLCRELANSPEFPRATELVASLGTARELGPILRRLDRAEGPALWWLCQSGRKAAATLAARRLQDTRGDELAAVALRYVIGDPSGDARSIEALLEHWVELAPNLAADRRYIHGELVGYTDSVRRCLTNRDGRHHRAFGDELFFRSGGKIRWLGGGFARDTLAAVAALRTHTIPFEIGFGPSE